jgi:hypothetical protein
VTETSGPSGYTTSYSSGRSGTAKGGLIKCTISNQYRTKPVPPALSPATLPPSNKPSTITITSNSRNVLSIPSTFAKVDQFSTSYTMSGKISSLNDLRNLITSTIVDDFDKDLNIGYVVESSSIGSSQTSDTTSSRPQKGLPNSFVSKDLINETITNEIQQAITAAATSYTSSTEKDVEIKCNFGIILADYNCR